MPFHIVDKAGLPRSEAVQEEPTTVCHSERSEESHTFSDIEMFRGVYPEQKNEILRFAQDDKRRAQHDSKEQLFGQPHEREVRWCLTFESLPFNFPPVSKGDMGWDSD